MLSEFLGSPFAQLRYPVRAVKHVLLTAGMSLVGLSQRRIPDVIYYALPRLDPRQKQ